MMDNYGTPPVTLVRGDGCEVVDAEGKTYLDFVAGIAVNTLGHAHPAVTAAVADQIGRLGHVSNLFAHEPGLDLAERLLGILNFPDHHARVLFCNSGAEANETAFKITRLTGRTKIVAADGGFHGRTMGALALTGQPSKQAPFEPFPPGVVHIPYGDADALDATVDESTAAVFLEPVQGENGVIVPPETYLPAAREIATRNGALLVLDEIQTGIGRTGRWFGFQHSGIQPDIVTLAKGIGGGLPLGACIGVGPAGDLLQAGQHGTTFGGNPVAAAAGLAVLETIESQGLLDHVAETGAALAAGIRRIDHPLIEDVRQAGLLIGIQLTKSIAGDAVAAARSAGYLINAAQPDVLRLCPPLLVQSPEIDSLLAGFPAVLDRAERTDEHMQPVAEKESS